MYGSTHKNNKYGVKMKKMLSGAMLENIFLKIEKLGHQNSLLKSLIHTLGPPILGGEVGPHSYIRKNVSSLIEFRTHLVQKFILC